MQVMVGNIDVTLPERLTYSRPGSGSSTPLEVVISVSVVVVLFVAAVAVSLTIIVCILARTWRKSVNLPPVIFEMQG